MRMRASLVGGLFVAKKKEGNRAQGTKKPEVKKWPRPDGMRCSPTGVKGPKKEPGAGAYSKQSEGFASAFWKQTGNERCGSRMKKAAAKSCGDHAGQRLGVGPRKTKTNEPERIDTKPER